MNVAELNSISGSVIKAGIEIHRALGPGLLESAYQTCLAYELREEGLAVRTQVRQPVIYKKIRMKVGYRVDLLVEESVIVELKATSKLRPIHEAQLLSYLKLSNCRVGLLINFHVPKLKDGIKRLVNRL